MTCKKRRNLVSLTKFPDNLQLKADEGATGNRLLRRLGLLKGCARGYYG